MNFYSKLKSLVIVGASGGAVFSAICLFKEDEKFYNNYVMPIIHKLDPETSHNIGVTVNKYNLLPSSSYKDPQILKTNIFGKEFTNPLGIAAGFDKHGEAVAGLHQLGFGFVEVGSVTPEPQPGNPKPRVFRFPEQSAIINRYGFNSDGHEKVYQRLEKLKNKNNVGIIGINLGKNKESSDPVNDYVLGVKKFSSVCDYMVINVSSPNTPGLRSMQDKENLESLLSAVLIARNNLPENERKPLFLKLSPDLNDQQKKSIADVLKKSHCAVDGLIISNTTISRPDNISNEMGGLSGKPLGQVSTDLIKDMYKLTDGKLPIIGVGGIFSGKDAYDKIRAGASLVQVYTSFIYGGPPMITRIKKELADLLTKDGYQSINEAVAANHKK